MKKLASWQLRVCDALVIPVYNSDIREGGKVGKGGALYLAQLNGYMRDIIYFIE